METLQAAPSATALPRRVFILGAILFVQGLVIYGVQFALKILTMPWYLPILATVGILCMAISVWQRPALGRGIGLGLFALLGAFIWFMALVGTRTPPYTGPALPGTAVPAFAALKADGTPFTHRDLADGKRRVLLFFRGRW